MISRFRRVEEEKGQIVDNSSLQAEGIGNIIIQMSGGAKALIIYVLYFHRMKCNMLSVGQLVEKGLSVVMKDGALELFDIQNNLVMKSPLSKNRIFRFMISLNEVQCLKTVVDHRNSWL